MTRFQREREKHDQRQDMPIGAFRSEDSISDPIIHFLASQRSKVGGRVETESVLCSEHPRSSAAHLYCVESGSSSGARMVVAQRG
jgi:hypothetical protein